MIGKPFINEALTKAIEIYLKYKDNPEHPDFHTFPVQVVKTLVYIYGELDIINPYITQNEHNLGGFDNNITKFGYDSDKLEDFKNLFLTFEQEVKENKYPNLSFMAIQKHLIEMFLLKKTSMNLPNESLEEFQKYLYLESNTDEYIKADLLKYVTDTSELELYFKSLAYETAHNFTLEEIQRNTLYSDAYTLLGYSMEQINGLNDLDLQKVNTQVYNFFRVDSNDPEKDELLLRAVNYYKKYGNRITSGNGFVDLLLFASILATGVFISILFAFQYL